MAVLKSDRLCLRPMVLEDAAMIVRWRGMLHVARSAKLTKGNISLEQHKEWFVRTRDNRLDYVIELTEDKVPIGSLSFAWRVLPGFNLSAELGKFIGEERFLGQGYASEATKLWLDYGFNKLKLDVVVARTRKGNLSNIRVNEKMGFSIEPRHPQFNKTSDEWVFMQLTHEQWRANR